MKVVLDTEDNFIIKILEKSARDVIVFFYGWVFNENTAILGHILGIIHFMLVSVLVILIILCHTLYPAFWAQCTVYLFLILTWLQHVFLQACFITVAEKKFTQNTSPFNNIFKNVLGLNATDFMSNVLLVETIAVAAFGLEITSILMNWGYNRIGVNI
jgi:hypothetical protein